MTKVAKGPWEQFYENLTGKPLVGPEPKENEVCRKLGRLLLTQAVSRANEVVAKANLEARQRGLSKEGTEWLFATLIGSPSDWPHLATPKWRGLSVCSQMLLRSTTVPDIRDPSSVPSADDIAIAMTILEDLANWAAFFLAAEFHFDIGKCVRGLVEDIVQLRVGPGNASYLYFMDFFPKSLARYPGWYPNSADFLLSVYLLSKGGPQ